MGKNNKGDKEGVAPPHPDAKPLPRTTNGHFTTDLRGNMRKAIEIMIDEGVSDNLAAQRANVRIDNLRRALARPNVIALFNQRIKDIRQNAGVQAYVRNTQLAQTSESDHVKADLNKWLAGVDGISPLQKVQGTHAVTHKFEGYKYDRPDAVDVTPTDQTSGGHDDDSQ
ncbi:MAG: hypothetical protein ACPG4X_16545 [Pikeienuella sp.]